MKHLNIKVIFFSLLFAFTSQATMAASIQGKQFKDWQGRCQTNDKNRQFCYILQGFSADGKTPLMITTVDLVQDSKFPIVTMRVSNKLDMEKQVAFQVDKNKPIGLKANCVENECSVAFRLDKRMLGEFKRGGRGVIRFFAKGEEKPVFFPVSLSGFTKAINTLRKS
jgi:invasion protein IalB